MNTPSRTRTRIASAAALTALAAGAITVGAPTAAVAAPGDGSDYVDRNGVQCPAEWPNALVDISIGDLSISEADGRAFARSAESGNGENLTEAVKFNRVVQKGDELSITATVRNNGSREVPRDAFMHETNAYFAIQDQNIYFRDQLPEVLEPGAEHQVEVAFTADVTTSYSDTIYVVAYLAAVENSSYEHTPADGYNPSHCNSSWPNSGLGYEDTNYRDNETYATISYWGAALLDSAVSPARAGAGAERSVEVQVLNPSDEEIQLGTDATLQFEDSNGSPVELAPEYAAAVLPAGEVTTLHTTSFAPAVLGGASVGIEVFDVHQERVSATGHATYEVMEGEEGSVLIDLLTVEAQSAEPDVTRTASFTLTNTGGEDLVVNPTDADGIGVQLIDSATGDSLSIPSDIALPAHGSATIDARFTPAIEGWHWLTLDLVDQHTATMIGSLSADYEVSPTQAEQVAPEVTIDSFAVTPATAVVGEERVPTITIAVDGDYPLVVGEDVALTIAGDEAGELNVDASGTALWPGSPVTLTGESFIPTVSGTLTATVTDIASGDVRATAETPYEVLPAEIPVEEEELPVEETPAPVTPSPTPPTEEETPDAPAETPAPVTPTPAPPVEEDEAPEVPEETPAPAPPVEEEDVPEPPVLTPMPVLPLPEPEAPAPDKPAAPEQPEEAPAPTPAPPAEVPEEDVPEPPVLTPMPILPLPEPEAPATEPPTEEQPEQPEETPAPAPAPTPEEPAEPEATPLLPTGQAPHAPVLVGGAALLAGLTAAGIALTTRRKRS